MLPIAAAAASPSALQRLQAIPAGVWLRIGVAIIAVVLVVIVLGKVARMNKVILAVIVGLVGSIVGFNWIYQRNEPSWATPVVEKLAGFFPTKDSLK